MNHLLQQSFGTANVDFICTFYLQYHPLLFEICHMRIVTNGQEVRCGNLLHFSMPAVPLDLQSFHI